MSEDELTIEQRLVLVEHVLAQLQATSSDYVGYLGICLNSMLDNKQHPHWDDEMVALAKAIQP